MIFVCMCVGACGIIREGLELVKWECAWDKDCGFSINV